MYGKRECKRFCTVWAQKSTDCMDCMTVGDGTYNHPLLVRPASCGMHYMQIISFVDTEEQAFRTNSD